MPNDPIVVLIRNNNPVTHEPTLPIDRAWDGIVAAHRRGETAPRLSRRHSSVAWAHPRRILAVSVAVLLIAVVSTVISVRENSNPHSITNSIARAFGVVNADAATTGGFSATPSSPQGFNVLTCPSSKVCYLESTNFVGVTGDRSATTAYKSVDGGTSWTSLSMPAEGNADTSFSCSSVSVCSIGVLRSVPRSPTGPFPQGSVQSMLSTTDGGTTWTSHVVAIDPVRGIDATLDSSLVNVQGQWSQLQCFSAVSCIAVALVPSDQPQEPFEGGGASGVLRTVIMRTEDGGITWTSSVLPWSKAFDGSPGWSNAQMLTLSCATPSNCVGLSSVLHSVVNNAQTSNVLVWRSSNGGSTWQTHWAPTPALESPLHLSCPTTLQCYAAVETGKRVPGGTDEIMMTKDGGNTWIFESPAPTARAPKVNEYNSVSCTSASTCWVAGEILATGPLGNSQAAIWATNDAGKRWTSVPLSIRRGVILQVACTAPASCLAVALPPFKSGHVLTNGPLPGKILSNRSS